MYQFWFKKIILHWMNKCIGNNEGIPVWLKWHVPQILCFPQLHQFWQWFLPIASQEVLWHFWLHQYAFRMLCRWDLSGISNVKQCGLNGKSKVVNRGNIRSGTGCFFTLQRSGIVLGPNHLLHLRQISIKTYTEVLHLPGA